MKPTQEELETDRLLCAVVKFMAGMEECKKRNCIMCDELFLTFGDETLCKVCAT